MPTDEKQTLVPCFSAAATVNEDGTPSVSPWATFGILDRQASTFETVRASGTLRNREFVNVPAEQQPLYLTFFTPSRIRVVATRA
ncbi:hypothetical protein IWQ52_005323 [Labrenzia sp. EL_159]|nr:hypothetical protein [Labrenzia sp. EL_162]MBG6197773.1 hypothetical protein [Labrenzia sp. EL_159]